MCFLLVGASKTNQGLVLLLVGVDKSRVGAPFSGS